MTDSQPPALESGRELDEYRIIRRVGVGGMGSVYEAEHVALGRRVALKTLNPEVAHNADIRARFVREGQAVARIRHPNIVGVSHVGEVEKMTYLVMDFLDGEDLASRIAREGPLPSADAVEIVLAVVSAIDAAHDAGVIHRDLKPANVFLERTRRGMVPKVLDFGISKVADRTGEVTRSLALLGSPHYMSPEQARSSKNVDWRTDLYAIGVILYECLTGRRPFVGETIFELVYAISSEDPVAPSERNPALPTGIDDVVLRAMARRPEDRFASLRAFALALVPFAPPESQRRWLSEFNDARETAAPPTPSQESIPFVDTLMSASREVPQPPRATATTGLGARFVGAVAVGAGLVIAGIVWSRGATPPARAQPASPVVRAEPAAAIPTTTLPATTPEPAPPPAPPAPTPAPSVAVPRADAGAQAPTAVPPAPRGVRARAPHNVAAAPVTTPPPAAPTRPQEPGDDDFRVR
jgi:serine/threonine-protein kinase